MSRRLFTMLMGVGLGWAPSVFGQGWMPAGGVPPYPQPNQVAPAPMMPNPYLAQIVGQRLRESGILSQYRINVYSQDGIVDLVGEIGNESQREAVLGILRTVPGIVSVRDFMQVRQDSGVMQTQGVALPMPPVAGQTPPVPLNAPVPILAAPAPFVGQNPAGPFVGQNPAGPFVGQNPASPFIGQNPPPPPAGQNPPMLVGPPLPLMGPNAPVPGRAPRIDGQFAEPMPIFQAPPGPNPAMQPPPMPPYAWPTVAPYNNYSRVAYPNAYPYDQFPFIGPMYPFPKVPLGWRSVSLTWQDGYWWYARNPSGHDWWRIRYH